MTVRELPACDYRFRRGWWCSRRRRHCGPCALRPRWWNRTSFARKYRASSRSLR